MTPIDRTQVIQPDADLAAIEDHTIGISAHAEALRASGRHIKRGLLLYGPPGTGKTWSVTHLRTRMHERTTIVINGGPGIGALGQGRRPRPKPATVDGGGRGRRPDRARGA
jgi:AAA domain (dynein-related subfamily)